MEMQQEPMIKELLEISMEGTIRDEFGESTGDGEMLDV
jgi:hypothetical protein